MRDKFIKTRIVDFKLRKSKVTIAIGFISKASPPKSPDFRGRIVVASDSQTTIGDVKRMNPNKIELVEFANGKILIAMAGSVEIADAVIEDLRKTAILTKIDNEESPINALKSSLLKIRSHLIEINKPVVIDVTRFFYDYSTGFLVGYYFGSKPCLHSINIHLTIPKSIREFEAIGSGEQLGYMFLQEHHQGDGRFEHGLAIATDVVERVCQHVATCQGPTWVAIAEPGDCGLGNAYMVDRHSIDLISVEIRKARQQEGSQLGARIRQAMRDICSKEGAIWLNGELSPDGQDAKIHCEIYGDTPEEKKANFQKMLKNRGINIIEQAPSPQF